MNHEEMTQAQGLALPGGDKIASGLPKSANPELDRAQAIIKADAEHRSLKADQVIMLKMVAPHFDTVTKQLSHGLFSWFQHQGFWPKWWRIPANYVGWNTPQSSETVTIPLEEYTRLKKMEKLGLIVTEVAEAMEAVRHGDLKNELEEMADIEVRHKDYLGGFGHADVYPEAFSSKMLKNYDRPLKHGKEF